LLLFLALLNITRCQFFYLFSHQLVFQNGLTKWYLPSDPLAASGSHQIRLKLPNDIACTKCILQWRYRAGEKVWQTKIFNFELTVWLFYDVLYNQGCGSSRIFFASTSSSV